MRDFSRLRTPCNAIPLSPRLIKKPLQQIAPQGGSQTLTLIADAASSTTNRMPVPQQICKCILTLIVGSSPSRKVGKIRQSHITTSQLNRSDEGRALLGPWFDGAFERGRVAERGISQQRNEKQVHSKTRVAATIRGGNYRRGTLRRTYLIVPPE